MPAPSSSASSAGVDWSPFAQQIVEDAQAALGFPFVLLSRVNLETRTSHPVFFGGLQLIDTRRAARLGRRLVPHYNMHHAALPVDRNPLMQTLCDQGQSVAAPLEDFTRGLVPPLITMIAGHIAGIFHCLAIPLCIEGQVIGTLSCYQRHPHFTDLQRRTAQAFARQVALNIHNQVLLDAQRRSAAALVASHQLLSQAEERTRRTISEFLHSQVQSKLLVAWYKLGEIPTLNGEAQQRLEAVRHELEYLREHDVRLLSHLLHPEALGVGLLPALQVLISRLDPVLSVQLVTNTALVCLDEASGLPMALRLVAFRTVEEALNNVLKHARARQVTIWLTVAENILALEVVDDGQGFDVTQAPTGLGLLCLGARIEAVGGHWRLDSRPGGPTQLWAEWNR